MACIPPPRLPPHPNKLHLFTAPRFLATPSLNRSIVCRSSSSDGVGPGPGPGPGPPRGWESLLHDAVKSAVKRWDDYVTSHWSRPTSEGESLPRPAAEDGTEEDGEWDWERWKRHFAEAEEEEKIIAVLKSQLKDAVVREDYEDAAKLKLAISTASKNDTVGTAIFALNQAIDEERYIDAAFIRDHAGAGLRNFVKGLFHDHSRSYSLDRVSNLPPEPHYMVTAWTLLMWFAQEAPRLLMWATEEYPLLNSHEITVGWWAGISENSDDPYGRIIRITAEHKRYVARSYNSRQLATGRAGLPLFEILFTDDDGEYKQQAVYLKWSSRQSRDFPMKSSKDLDGSSLNPSESSTEQQKDKYTEDVIAAEEREEDSDVADGLSGIQNILQDMIPGIKVKVLKVVSPGKVDRDLIAKVIEQIMDEEDEDDDEEGETTEAEDVGPEGNIEEIGMDAGDATTDATMEPVESPMKMVIGTLMQTLPSNMTPKDKIRIPAKLERRGRLSFSFSIEHDGHETDEERTSRNEVAVRSAKQSADLVMSDLAKVILGKEKIPMKVLRDVGQLISSAINQNQNHESLSGTTHFNRIEIPPNADPLSGLYVGSHGMYTSEILHLKRKFGQWQVDDATQKLTDLEFYEYVEAFKLTGGLSVPAGQVAFRAKVGKQYQLPHKGIIPEEFGVVARYKGQGRIADPGFQNPRWVDGELVILDGKHVREGPVIGFVYWAPEYHFLVFFNRLRLPD